ncbi:MAG: hypothetical protein KDA91_07470 [Planctomycetaceae bacterium]|nr:hypothetical protein [Planctomycetaceae bacterium]
MHCDNCGTLSVIPAGGMADLDLDLSGLEDAEPYASDEADFELEDSTAPEGSTRASVDPIPTHLPAESSQPEADFELADDIAPGPPAPELDIPDHSGVVPESPLVTPVSSLDESLPRPEPLLPTPTLPTPVFSSLPLSAPGGIDSSGAEPSDHELSQSPTEAEPSDSEIGDFDLNVTDAKHSLKDTTSAVESMSDRLDPDESTSAKSAPERPSVPSGTESEMSASDRNLRQDALTGPSAQDGFPIPVQSQSPLLTDAGDAVHESPETIAAETGVNHESELTGDDPVVETDAPPADADTVIGGDLMFFFESLEDAPEDVAPPVATSPRSSIIPPAVAAAAVARAAKSGAKPKSKNPLGELFELLNSETSAISHVSEDEADFRTALRTYFDGLPNHNLASKADKAAIDKIIDLQSGRLTLNVFHEKRSLVKRTVAYKGWSVPEKKRDETNTRAWDISWKPPKEPSTEEETKIVSDSQELHGCTRCAQTGETSCKKCQGKGKLGCSACTMTGVTSCMECAGTGQKTRVQKVRGSRRCTTCGGAGTQQYIPADDPEGAPKTRTCAKCAGSGRESFVENQNFAVACDACKNTGKAVCPVCRGKRAMACRDCSGRGAKQCRQCQGSKILVTYLEVKRVFEVESVSTELVGSYSQEMLSRSCQKPFTIGHQQLHHWGGAGTDRLASSLDESAVESEGLAASAKTFLNDGLLRTALGAESRKRTTAWKIDLEQHSTRSVVYSIGKRRYRTLWDTVESDSASASGAVVPRVFSHRSIVTNWCLAKMNELRKEAETTGVRDAALQYQRLQAIAEVDPATQLVISEHQSAKDDTLQQIVAASRTVKASKAQLIFYGLALLILLAAVPVWFLLNDLVPVIGCVVASLVVAIIGWKLLAGN